jgi:PBSX family phage terminase large subunit
MSLLANIAGGNCLEKPASAGTRCEETYESLRDRILDSLLPAQKEFCLDNTTKIIGFCAGFGAGKTKGLAAKCVLLAMDNPGTVMAVFEPTAVMIRDVWLRAFDEFLEDFDIPYDFRVSPSPEYILHLPTGTTTVLCRATETWNRLRGQTLSAVLADEIDTSPQEIAQKAIEMMLARLRGGVKPQLALASTPEGYRALHRLFVQDFHDAEAIEDHERLAVLKKERRLIRARTADNPYLPEGFIESLISNYPPQLIASYLEGHFTLLVNTKVYASFDRDIHWCDTKIEQDDRLLVGCDFNVGAVFAEVVVRRGNEFHIVAEHYPKDTPSLVRLLQETYPDHYEAGTIAIVPDAASRHRSTANAAESDLSILRKGGFIVKNQLANPPVADRINCVNVLLNANRLRVHNGCRYLIKSMEQQAFDATGRPEKGRGGLEDLSGPVDALGYVIYKLAPLQRYATGGSNFTTY